MKDAKYLMLWILFIVELIAAITSVFVLEKGTTLFLPLVITGLLCALVFAIVTIGEIMKSERIKPSEKIMWIVCMLFIFNITGLLYLILRRKRIIGSAGSV
jgi:hypothetical protein